MASLRRRASELEPLPPVWSNETVARDEKRTSVYQDTKAWVSRLILGVQREKIRPSGKHGRDLSHILGQALTIFAETPPAIDDSESDLSAFSQCKLILKLLDDWNLHPQPLHYAATIAAAACEGNWKEAADLFWLQINPDASGYVPMEDVVHLELGLYSIARYAQLQGGAAAEQVMDAVLNMSMVSPTDQDKYVTSAGRALGRAGEWQACVDYLKNSYSSSRLGQPMVAAAMQACTLCSEPEKALNLYDELVEGPLVAGGEWQWAGGSNSLHPLCRDLAMRALGQVSNGQSGARAVRLLRQVQDEGFQVSIGALCGVIQGCERDKNWRDAVSVLNFVIDNWNETGQIVGDDSELLAIGDVRDSDANSKGKVHGLSRIREIVPLVLRTCNASHHFGLALFCSRLVELAFEPEDPVAKQQVSAVLAEREYSEGSELERSLLALVVALGLREDAVAALMTSLCGLGFFREAADLFEMVITIAESRGLGETKSSWPYAVECYEYATSRIPLSDETTTAAWKSAHIHLHRLTAAAKVLKTSINDISPSQSHLLAAALARAMQCCTAAGEPETSLAVASYIAPLIEVNAPSGSLWSLFGLKDDRWDDNVLVADKVLLTEVLRAHRANGNARHAMKILMTTAWWKENNAILSSAHSGVQRQLIREWSPMEDEVMRLLCALRRDEEALSLFRSRSLNSRTPDSFLIMAESFQKRGQWAALGDLYHVASKSGCLTENIGLLAMESVEKSHMDGKIRVLRDIVDDTSDWVGVYAQQWQRSRYWTIKRRVGWHYARLLMWWNDEEEAVRRELELAFEQFKERRSLRLKPKTDIVRAIVSGANRHEIFGTVESDDNSLPKSTSEWADILREVVDEIRGTSFENDARFVDELSRAFKAVGANRDCVDLVTGALSRQVPINHAAVNEAVLAAELEEIDNPILSLLAHSAER